MSYAENDSEVTYERVVATKRQGKLALLCMVSDDLSNGLADPRHEARVLELPDGRVILGINRFELVVAIELNLPAKLYELLGQAGLDEVDGTFVHPELGLCRWWSAAK